MHLLLFALVDGLRLPTRRRAVLGALAAQLSTSTTSLATGVDRVPDTQTADLVCVTALPNGAVFDASSSQAAAGSCQRKARTDASRTQVYAADAHFRSSATPLTTLTADFVVPPLPAGYNPLDPHMVYFWPGLKSKQPEMCWFTNRSSCAVLQPVLQFGLNGRSWSLQSWFIDGGHPTAPAVTVPAIEAQPGDRMTSYVGLSADGSTWTVSGTNKRTGADSTLHVVGSSVSYEYAMLVNEQVNVGARCERLPTWPQGGRMGFRFTNVTVNGEQKPAWSWTTRAKCAGNELCDCDNAATVSENGDVTLSWRSHT